MDLIAKNVSVNRNKQGLVQQKLKLIDKLKIIEAESVLFRIQKDQKTEKELNLERVALKFLQKNPKIEQPTAERPLQTEFHHNQTKCKEWQRNEKENFTNVDYPNTERVS
jgi:hypothetical protein